MTSRSAVITGLCCALSTIFVNVAVRVFFVDDATGSGDYLGSVTIGTADPISYLKLVSITLIGPVVETILFAGLFFGIATTVPATRGERLCFAVVMGALGWLLHGAGWMSISRGIGFAILGIFYAMWHVRVNWIRAFWATSLAHVTWNSSSLGIIFGLGLLRG